MNGLKKILWLDEYQDNAIKSVLSNLQDEVKNHLRQVYSEIRSFIYQIDKIEHIRRADTIISNMSLLQEILDESQEESGVNIKEIKEFFEK
jgi:hypothetical protein